MTTRKALDTLRPYIPGKPINDVKKEFHLTEVTKLASNENPYGCSNIAKAAVIESLNEVALYPDGNCSDLKSALADYHKVEMNQLIIGAGSDEIIGFLAHAFIDPKDEAITCSPSFPQYESAVKIMDGHMINVPLLNHAFDLNGMLSEITSKTKMVFISNPNNPTGTIVPKKELLDFIQKVPQNVLIVLDEAYCDYAICDDYLDSLPLLENFSNIIILRTFSKMYGLASLRVGYGIGSPEIIGNLNKVRGPFNVTSSAQAAAIGALSDKDFVNYCYMNNDKVKEFSYKKATELGLSYIPSYGNFFMLDCKKDSMALFQSLQKLGYIVRPGFFFGMPTYQRVTFGTIEQMTGFFDTLATLL